MLIPNLIVPSSSVRNLTTSTEGLDATSIFVSWEVPILNDLNGILVNYSINYSGIEIDTVPRVSYLSNPNLTNQSITLIDLEEYTTYSINVSSYTKVGKGPDAILTHRTNQDGECPHIYFLLLLRGSFAHAMRVADMKCPHSGLQPLVGRDVTSDVRNL